MSETVLYDYWRSTASYRVRIALYSLGMSFTSRPVDLLAGDHRNPAHVARNPQGFVPVLEIDGLRLTQSLAMIEYLDDARKAGFLPQDAASRARVRALADVIAMDTHPICNPSVVAQVLKLSDDKDSTRLTWMQHFIRRGLEAFNTLMDHPDAGPFCHGDSPGLAEFCLIPQLYNARRWEVDYSDLSRICAVEQACAERGAFALAAPKAPDAT